MQGDGLLHTEPMAAPSCLCCAPDSPPAIPSHTEDSIAIPGAQGVCYMLHSALPSLIERVKVSLAVTAKALVLNPLLQHPVPSKGNISSQESFGYQGSQPGPHPSLSSDSRGAFRLSQRPPSSPPRQSWSHWRG